MDWRDLIFLAPLHKYYFIMLHTKNLRHLHFFTCLFVTTIAISQQESTFTINWAFKAQNSIYATAAVSGNIIYIGSLDSNLYALDANSGELMWSFKAKYPIRSNALIHEGAIYFESGNILHKLSPRGSLIWERQLHGSITDQIDPWDFYHSSPIFYNNSIYLGTEKGKVFGVDCNSGKLTFSCQTDSKVTIRSTPVIDGGLIYFGDWDGVFYAYQIASGNLAWKYDTKKDVTFKWNNSIQCTPLIYQEMVLFGGRSCRVYALDKTNGDRTWRYASPTDQWLIGGLAMKSDTLLFGSSDQHLLYAINIRNGAHIWETKLDSRGWATPLLVNNQVFFASQGLHKIELATGSIGPTLNFEPMNTEKKYGEYVDIRANFHSSPVSWKNNILIGADNGTFYSISKP